MSGILVRFGAAISLPSRSYVHAWYMHWNARFTWPSGSAHSRTPRCRQMLKNARISPRRFRETMTLSRPICTVRNDPGPSRSAARTAQNHVCSKIAACSAANTSGAT